MPDDPGQQLDLLLRVAVRVSRVLDDRRGIAKLGMGAVDGRRSARKKRVHMNTIS
jgi:hypothetical protein